MESGPVVAPDIDRFGSDEFAVIDVETSGLSARRHRILQVAIVTVDGTGNVVDRWSSYVRPRFRRVGPSEVHGLTARSLRSAPSFNVIAPEVARRLAGRIVVGHNVAFDWAFVANALGRAGIAPPTVSRLCTLRLSRGLDPDRVLSHRLADVALRHDVSLEHAHDALADAEATAAVLPSLLAAAGVSSPDELRAHFLRPRRRYPWHRRLQRRLRRWRRGH